MFHVPRVFDDLTVADNRRAAALMAGQECVVDPSEVLPNARPARGHGHRYRQQERHDRRPPSCGSLAQGQSRSDEP